VTGLVHTGLDAQLLARREPERPGGGPGTGDDAGHGEREQEQDDEGPAGGLRRVGDPGRGQRPHGRGERARQVQPGGDGDDESADHADEEDAVRGAAHALDGPADRLAEGRRGEDPGQHHELCAEESPGRRDEGRDREQAPHLDEPGEVDGREHEGTEVLGDRTDRVHRRLAAREQLTTSAAGHRGTHGQQQEADERGAEVSPDGRERALHCRRADGARVEPGRTDREPDGQGDHDEHADRAGAPTAHGPGAEGQQVAGVPRRLEPGVSRGAHGRPRR
jgi:hypothetical protein